MSLKIKQISSLEKILPKDMVRGNEVFEKTLLRGQSFNYQIVLTETVAVLYDVSVESPIADQVHLYTVQNAQMDLPTSAPGYDQDFITEVPGIMPDILMPMELEKNTVKASYGSTAVWVEVRLDKNTPAGEYPIKITFKNEALAFETSSSMLIKVAKAVLPEQKLLFTQWFHVDCIADVHNVEIYSKKHWELIEKYMMMAKRVGINMILTS